MCVRVCSSVDVVCLHSCSSELICVFSLVSPSPQDLCLLANGEAGRSMKVTGVSRLLGLELLDIVLNHHGAVFESHAPFLNMARTRVRLPLPLFLRLVSDCLLP